MKLAKSYEFKKFNSGEIEEKLIIRKNRTVQNEGDRKVVHEVEFYS